MADTLLEGLNPAQRQAVLWGDGPCLCVAGAGSGKTRVLTDRIRVLLDQDIPGDQILALTFTKKAAEEMRARLSWVQGPLIGTIHSVCYRILRQYWANRDESYDILSGYAQKRVIRDLLAAPGRENPHGMNWDLDVKLALGQIGYWKNALIMPEDIDITQPNGARWRQLYLLYEAHKKRAGLMDLDDMLLWAWHLLETNTGVRQAWQRTACYVLVDEAQDSSLIQWRIIETLAAPEDNLFVVGDADQSIYAFRGGRPDYLSDFATRHPKAVTVTLDRNYRSLPYVVDLGNRLINVNPRSTLKAVRATRHGPIQAPTVWTPQDENDEGREIARYVRTLHDEEGTLWADMAVIYRTNAQSQPIEDALIAAKIPYQILGGTGFWARKEVRDLLAYLRLLRDPHDTEAYQRTLFNPSRYLGKVFVSQVLEYAQHSGQDLIQATRNVPAKPYQQRNAREWVGILEAVRGLHHPDDQIDAIRDLTGYDAWFLKQGNGDDDDDGADRLGNLDALIRAAGQFATADDLLDHVDRVESQAQAESGQPDKVTLLTVHRAKGLEWPVVILPGVVQGLLPHKHAVSEMDDENPNPGGIQEERRLAYVALTRARDVLVLSSPRSRYQRAQEPSQFLAEMGIIVGPAEIEMDQTISRR